MELRGEVARLKSIIAERDETIKHLKREIEECHNKEHSISTAITFAMERSNQLESSRRKLYELDLQRSRLLYMRMEQVLTDLYKRYPELKKEHQLKGMADKFKEAVYNQYDATTGYKPSSAKYEDPIRKLLNNIITYIDSEHETGTITRKDTITERVGGYSHYANTPSNSGFDINEALNPTENLEEILKSFNLKIKK